METDKPAVANICIASEFPEARIQASSGPNDARAGMFIWLTGVCRTSNFVRLSIDAAKGRAIWMPAQLSTSLQTIGADPEEFQWPSECQLCGRAMQHAVEFKNVEPTPDIKNRIETLVARTRKKAHSFAPEPVFLRCAVEQVPVHKLFRVSITLDVPQKTLAAKEEAHDADAAIRAAFEEVERQLDAYKASLRGEQWWKQTHKRKELRRLKIGGGESLNQDREW